MYAKYDQSEEATPEATITGLCSVTGGVMKPVIVYDDCGNESATAVPASDYDISKPGVYLQGYAQASGKKLPDMVLVQVGGLAAVYAHEKLRSEDITMKLFELSYVVKFPLEDERTAWIGIPESAKGSLPKGFYDYVKSLAQKGGSDAR